MNTPKEIQDVYAMTLEELRKTDGYMSSPAYKDALKGKPLDVRKKANDLEMQTHLRRLDLENVVLENIVASLTEHDNDLKEAIADLSAARKKIRRVKEFLETLGKVLEIIAKVLVVL